VDFSRDQLESSPLGNMAGLLAYLHVIERVSARAFKKLLFLRGIILINWLDEAVKQFELSALTRDFA
jgi:hypothetical protein